MSLSDMERPLYNRIPFSELGLDENKFYYVSFFNNGKLDTRPIKIKGVFSVHSTSAGSAYLRTEARWSYHFETEKEISKKLIDPKFWKRIFNDYGLVRKPITESWKIDFDEDWDSLDYYLIGENPDEAKLRLIMAGLDTPYSDDNGNLEIIKRELDYYNETQPDLVLKAMDFKIDKQYGNITDYSKHFLSIKDDIRNQ